MKPEIRILGIDDAAFDRFLDKEVKVVGVLFRGGDFMDGAMSCTATVDGIDATSRISEMIQASKFKEQIRAVMLDGIAVGGFNVVNIEKLSGEIKIPVMAIMRDYPELERMKEALVKIGMAKKIKVIESAGKIHRFGKIHFQAAGLAKEEAEKILKISVTRSGIPEPLRVAHIIAQGISLGESRGRA